MNIHLNDIFKAVKSDFCTLVDFKIRGDTIEIITGIPTISSSFVSLFISQQDNQYVISDGGWIHQGMYDNQVNDDTVYDRVLTQYIEHFNISQTRTSKHVLYYYKKVASFDLISSAVFDVGYFVSNVVNAQMLQYTDVNENKDRRVFHNEMNSLLRHWFHDKQVETNFKVSLNPQYSIRFNAAVIVSKSVTYYTMYVTGSNQSYFNKDLTKAVLNFEMLDEGVSNKNYLRKVALINTNAPGWNPDNSAAYLHRLANVVGHEPIYIGNTDLINEKKIKAIISDN